MKKIRVKVLLNEDDIKNINRTLELRYLLADTIEERGLGQIINEGTGEGYIDISFETENVNLLDSNLKELLISLGFTGENEIKVL